MSKPIKVPALLLGVITTIALSFGSAIVGSGTANANPGWCDARYASCQEWGGGWNDGWRNNDWRGHDCGHRCGDQGWNQMVWKPGPVGRPAVQVEYWKVNWRWCPDGYGEYYLAP